MLDPWSFQPTVKQLRENLPTYYRLKKFSHPNRNDSELTDTIYQFSYHRSSFFVFKASGREVFVGASLCDPCIVMRNGIHVGITRKEFFQCIPDLKPERMDTVRLISLRTMNGYNFIFKKDLLRCIKVDNRAK